MHMNKAYGDEIEFMDDGRPIVKETADTDVKGYFATTVFKRIPEWYASRLRIA